MNPNKDWFRIDAAGQVESIARNDVLAAAMTAYPRRAVSLVAQGRFETEQTTFSQRMWLRLSEQTVKA